MIDKILKLREVHLKNNINPSKIIGKKKDLKSLAFDINNRKLGFICNKETDDSEYVAVEWNDLVGSMLFGLIIEHNEDIKEIRVC